MTPARLPLHKMLGIKPGHTVSLINPPEGYMEQLVASATHVRIVRGTEEDADVIQAFVRMKSELEASFPDLKQVLGKPHALWVCWPGVLSGVATDLNTGIVRGIGEHNGLLEVKAGAIDDDWSGMKFVYRLNDR